MRHNHTRMNAARSGFGSRSQSGSRSRSPSPSPLPQRPVIKALSFYNEPNMRKVFDKLDDSPDVEYVYFDEDNYSDGLMNVLETMPNLKVAFHDYRKVYPSEEEDKMHLLKHDVLRKEATIDDMFNLVKHRQLKSNQAIIDLMSDLVSDIDRYTVHGSNVNVYCEYRLFDIMRLWKAITIHNLTAQQINDRALNSAARELLHQPIYIINVFLIKFLPTLSPHEANFVIKKFRNIWPRIIDILSPDALSVAIRYDNYIFTMRTQLGVVYGNRIIKTNTELYFEILNRLPAAERERVVETSFFAEYSLEIRVRLLKATKALHTVDRAFLTQEGMYLIDKWDVTVNNNIISNYRAYTNNGKFEWLLQHMDREGMIYLLSIAYDDPVIVKRLKKLLDIGITEDEFLKAVGGFASQEKIMALWNNVRIIGSSDKIAGMLEKFAERKSKL